MAQRLDIEGYTVRIWVPVRDVESFNFSRQTPRQAELAAAQIKAAIVRHLGHDHGDQWDYMATERVASAVCDSCGSAWTEKDTHYNGGCCDQDEADHEQAKADNGQLGVGA